MLKIKDYKLFSAQNIVLAFDDLGIEEGTYTHLQGNNSSGKSLFLKTLNGQYKNYKGSLLYRKKKMTDYMMNNNVILIGNYLPVVENMSFLDNIQLPFGGLNLIQRNRMIEMSTILGIVELLNFDMVYSSRSERLFIYLIRASLISPSILLIDDIDVYFDDDNYFRVYQLIQYCLKSGMIIVSTGKTAVDNIQNYMIKNGELIKL
jgi:ABC-type lipoprotein export system ATPase subunit